MIKFTNVFKAFPKGGLALKDVSFHVAKGEFAFLTGHSGAGKSTVMKLIYAEERPTSGEVRVSGYNVNEMRPRDVPMLRRKLGIVFQDFRLLEDRTAEENVAFALEVTGARVSTIAARVMRVLTQVGLAAKAQAYPRELSGGENRRCCSPTSPPGTWTSGRRAVCSSCCATSTPAARRSSWPRTTSTWCGRPRIA